MEVSLPGGKRTFHPLTSPREVVVLPSIDATDMEPQALTQQIIERGEGVAGGLDGKIVRLSIHNVSRETYRNLDHKELRALRAKALNLTLDIAFLTVRPDVERLNQAGKGVLKDQLIEFSKSWEVPGVEQSELAEVLSGYLAKVEAKHEAS